MKKYRFSGFSEKADTALNSAISVAGEMGHTYVGTEHLLLGLLCDPMSVAGVVLSGQSVQYKAAYDKLGERMGRGVPTVLTDRDMTPRLVRTVENALKESKKENSNVCTEHLLTALLRDSRSGSSALLADMNISPSALYADVARALRPTQTFAPQRIKACRQASSTAGGMLAKYGVCLTDAARAGRIDKVVCRDRETERVMRILCRRTKNNPCLIGEPGVGKTAAVEGLALRIAEGEVPELLLNKEVWSLELTAMVAGAKYRGDFEERIRGVVAEVTDADNIILFIDEIHNIIGAGSAEGAVDAANILKPVLARGKLHLIGATTADEYRRCIGKDAALERRFQPVTVEQPAESDALEILKSLRPAYEEHHGCKITDGALEAAVSMSVRYITDRFLPDKAIDLVDEAAAMVSMNAQNGGCSEKKREMQIRGGKIEEAVRLAESRKTETDAQCGAPEVTKTEIAQVVSEWTDIPAATVNADEKIRLANLENRLSKLIVGQKKAVKAVSDAIRRGRLGLKDPSRPVGTFLFCGPSGVGKTELAKAVAKEVFGSPDFLISFNMGEFSEPHSVARLIGSPPGYVGYGDGGQLTSRLRRRPYSVVLFDETEKAHPDVFNALLQLLDEGILTAADGRKVDCRNTVIIMTSNLGEKYIAGGVALGFGSAAENGINKELENVFRPEFLNRLDGIVIFEPLSVDELCAITRKRLEDVHRFALSGGIEVEFSDGVAPFIAEKAAAFRDGARPIGRLISELIETPLARDETADGGDGKKRTVSVIDGKICIERVPTNNSDTSG